MYFYQYLMNLFKKYFLKFIYKTNKIIFKTNKIIFKNIINIHLMNNIH